MKEILHLQQKISVVIPKINNSLLLLLVIVTPYYGQSQVFKKLVGYDYTKPFNHFTSDETTIYMCTPNALAFNRWQFTFYNHNNNATAAMPVLTTRSFSAGLDSLQDMVSYKGKLFLALRHDSLNFTRSKGSIIEYSGGKWSTSDTSKSAYFKGSESKFYICNDTLFQVEVSNGWIIKSYDAKFNSWVKLYSDTARIFIRMLEYKKGIYLTGPPGFGLKRLKGTLLQSEIIPGINGLFSPQYLQSCVGYNNSLYFKSDTGFKVLNNGTWSFFRPLKTNNVMSVSVHKDKLYFTANRTSNGVLMNVFGVMHQTSVKSIYELPGVEFNLKLPNEFLTRYKKLIAKGTFDNCNVVEGRNFKDWLALDENLPVTITGKVFFDNNGNCQPDVSEGEVKTAFIRVKPLDYLVSVGDSGKYIINCDTGNITLEVVPSPTKSLPVTCPPSGIFTTKFTGTNNMAQVNFGVDGNALFSDAGLEIIGHSGFRVRHGEKSEYTLLVSNWGTLPLSNLGLSLNIPDNVLDFSSTNATITGTQAKWTIPNLGVNESVKINFSLRNNPVKYKIGDSLKFFSFLTISPKSDIDSIDNRRWMVQRIVGAYDPNQKTSWPEKIVKVGTRELRYHIEFENTGNDFARRAEVIDSIDKKLPLHEMVFVSSSHSDKMRIIVKNNVIHWVFEGINLAGATPEKKGGTGYITFKAKIIDNWPTNYTINNKAYIFFDYQDPIVTNVAWVSQKDTTVDIPILINTKEAFKVYPNPANQSLTVENKSESFIKAEILNILGQKVKAFELSSKQSFTLPMEDLAIGIYFLTTNGFGIKKFVIQH